MIFKIFALFIVACVASSYGKGRMFGGIVVIDPNDELLRYGLGEVLLLKRSTSQARKVIYATRQLVAGDKYVAVFVNQYSGACIASWVDQPWISPAPQYVELLCP